MLYCNLDAGNLTLSAKCKATEIMFYEWWAPPVIF